MAEVTAMISAEAIADGRWVDLLAQNEGSSRYGLTDALFDEARRCHEGGQRSMEALYSVLGAICSYHYDGSDPLEPYEPYFVLTNGRAAMPADLRPSDLDALSEMLPLIPVSAVRARVADVLWIRKRDHEAARTAITSYVEASRSRQEHWEPEVLDQLERAMQVVTLLGKGGADLRAAPIQEAVTLLEGGSLSIGYETRLVRMLNSWGVDEGLQHTLDRASDRIPGEESNEDGNLLRGLHGLASLCAEALDRHDLAREHRVQIAESWVREAQAAASAESPSHMRAVGILEFAIKEYRSIGGCQARVDELHRMMLDWQSSIGDEMHSFSHSLDLTDVVRESVARVSGKSLPVAVVGLAHVHGFRDVEEMRAEVEQLMQDHPLQYLFSRSRLDDKGRVVARPASIGGGDDDTRSAAVSAEMDSQFTTTIELVAHGGIEPARRAVVSEHPVRQDELLQLLGPSPFIPPGHETTYVKGLWFGLRGDYATAAQVLAPELENALREQLMRAGVILPRLNGDVTQADRSLNVVLEHDKAEEVFGANKLFALRALLTSPFGANLRNRIAHGLTSDGELMSAPSAYLWWLALRLAVEPLIHIENVDPEAPDEGASGETASPQGEGETLEESSCS